MKRPPLAQTCLSALTFAGTAAVAAWMVDRLANTIRRTSEETTRTMGVAVSGMVSDLGKLVGVVEPVELIPQQRAEDWQRGQVSADETEQAGWGEFEMPDWTEQAAQDMDPRLEPEQIYLPPEMRKLGPTLIAPPDLAGEFGVDQ